MKTFASKKDNLKWTEEAKKDLETLLLSGHTLVELSSVFNTTKQNMSLIVKKHLPHLTRKDFGKTKKLSLEREGRLKEIQEKYGRPTWYWTNDLEKAHSDFFRRKKQNCKKTKWGWDIAYQDLEFPKHCPVLGLELDWFAETRSENSPSIDRIDSTKGYVKGNVAVMSWRANRIKNDGTLEEHQKIVEYLSKL